jgi:hypothetical protein
VHTIVRDTSNVNFTIRVGSGSPLVPEGSPQSGVAAASLPTEYMLEQNYPNPFNPQTMISFALPKAAIVSLRVYDLMGREVAELVNEEKSAGQYTVRFDARDLPTGLYICRMTASEFSASHKMMLIR